MSRRIKQNIIAGVVAGVGIILILSTVWVFTREHRFKNYKNKSYGFSIKYPALWALEENKNGAAVIFYSPQENDLDYFQESVNVIVQDISGNPMDIRDYSELAIKQMEVVFEDNLIIIESAPKFFAGQTGYIFIFIGKGSGTDYHYMSAWTIKDLVAYQITYTSLTTKYEQYISIAKKMLRSFRLP